MIPKLIHQTWKSDVVPTRLQPLVASWQAKNPHWRTILWTDRDLLSFVAEHHPAQLELFTSYSSGVARADAARYMLLKTFGGVYADIDTECLNSLDDLVDEDRVLLSQEPPSHWAGHAPRRGHPYVLFNGVMAGPKGHPFWDALVSRLVETRHAPDILDRTGPCFLTGVYLGFQDKAQVHVESCHRFTPTDSHGVTMPPPVHGVVKTYARHEWAGSWFSVPRAPRRVDVAAGLRRLRAKATRGAALTREQARAAVDTAILGTTPPKGENLAILVPVRDAASELRPFVDALAETDIDAGSTRLVFCEGDSADHTWQRLQDMLPELRTKFREVVLTQLHVRNSVTRENRSKRKHQRVRRAGLAKVRNHLIDVGITDDIDWALWIDVDVWKLQPDILARLKGTGARIAVPHCVKHPNGPTFDRNTFVDAWDYPARHYYKYMRGGLYLPPSNGRGRFHGDSLRHSDSVVVDGVGGTVMLVDANVHRAGIRFPELPYRDHIETEGFGLWARDMGVRAVLLPRLEVYHTPW